MRSLLDFRMYLFLATNGPGIPFLVCALYSLPNGVQKMEPSYNSLAVYIASIAVLVPFSLVISEDGRWTTSPLGHAFTIKY